MDFHLWLLSHVFFDCAVALLQWQRCEVTGNPPSPRYHGTVVLVGQELYAFGGADTDRAYNDMHVYRTGLFNPFFFLFFYGRVKRLLPGNALT